VEFEWDDSKNRANKAKHGVTFETAARVFLDPFAAIEPDRFAQGEARWLATGLVDGRQLLVVVHTTRNRDGTEVIRIISARSALGHERRRYESR
jgi:uncharacterized protein